VIRESGGDFSAVTGGTRVLSDWLVVRVTSNPGEGFIDRMIAMVEGAKRQKTPNEVALTILLIALTIIFLVVTVSLLPFSLFSVDAAKALGMTSQPISITVLIALLVSDPNDHRRLVVSHRRGGHESHDAGKCDRYSGRAVEAAGDVDILLLDKTGTITLGNRQASEFFLRPA
jgi:K+-transporting ATPase ATPase B chain